MTEAAGAPLGNGPVESDRAAATRARLLDAAREAFATKGFDATTTRDIAAAAGMSPAAVYIHHRSKEDLLYQIALDGHHRVLALVQEGAATSDDPREQLPAIVHRWVDHHLRERTMARIVNYEIASLTPEHRAEIDALRDKAISAVGRIVQAGKRQGVFRTKRPDLATAAILSLAVDTSRWYQETPRWTPKTISDYYADLALVIVQAKD